MKSSKIKIAVQSNKLSTKKKYSSNTLLFQNKLIFAADPVNKKGINEKKF